MTITEWDIPYGGYPNAVAQDHGDWHAVNGPYNCPWDAASCESPEQREAEAAWYDEMAAEEWAARTPVEKMIDACRSARSQSQDAARRARLQRDDPWASTEPPF